MAENPSNFGYRAMHQKLMTMRISVDRDTVRQILKHADPEGVECRSKKILKRRKYYAKGPNDIWHIDGNDKLKPYGFEIHGCIDGYSRKVLWMRIVYSNKDPRTVIYYYLVTVKNVNGFPCRVRADRGVENSLIAGVQRFFSRREENADGSFIFGKSTGNQRIEA